MGSNSVITRALIFSGVPLPTPGKYVGEILDDQELQEGTHQVFSQAAYAYVNIPLLMCRLLML